MLADQIIEYMYAYQNTTLYELQNLSDIKSVTVVDKTGFMKNIHFC